MLLNLLHFVLLVLRFGLILDIFGDRHLDRSQTFSLRFRHRRSRHETFFLLLLDDLRLELIRLINLICTITLQAECIDDGV